MRADAFWIQHDTFDGENLYPGYGFASPWTATLKVLTEDTIKSERDTRFQTGQRVHAHNGPTRLPQQARGKTGLDRHAGLR